MGDDPRVYDDESTEQSYGWNPSGSSDTTTDSEPKSLSGQQLTAAEESAPQQTEASKDEKELLGNGYSDEPTGGGLRGALSGKRRRLAIGGGFAGIGITGAVLALLGVGSGPLQFVHIAQILQKAHFSSQEDASDGRFGKMVRYLRSGRDIGETRLSYLESRYKNNIIRSMNERGIYPRFDERTGYLKDFIIDGSDPKSPYYGKNSEEVRASFNERLSTKVTVAQFSGQGGGKYKISTDSVWGSSERATFRALTTDLGYSKVTTSMRGRIISRYGGFSWHPMHALDKQFNKQVINLYDKWKQAREERLKNGIQEGSVDPTKASSTDEKGKASSATGEKQNLSSSTVKDTFDKISSSGGFKVAGGIAFAAGLVCLAHAVNEESGAIKNTQIIIPLMRMGMEAVTVGNQIMSGQDVDPQEMSFLAKNFTAADSKGNVVNSWDEARSIQAELGQPLSGPDIPDAAKGGFDDNSFLAWTENPAVGAMCSKVGSFLTTGLSIAVGVFSGGTVSTALSIVGGLALGPVVINKLAGLLSGEAVNVAAQGAEWGNYINYGSRLGSNAIALQFGGNALNQKQVAELKQSQQQDQRNELKQESIASRLFNIYDYRSLASTIIDRFNPNPTLFAYGLASTASAAVKLPTALLSGTVHADPQPYDYGFDKYGFSLEDLNNPTVDNPYDNAEAAAKLLDGPNGNDYVAKAAKCYGLTINKGDQGWDVLPGGSLVNVYDAKNYNPSDCTMQTIHETNDWLRIRFFILDTATMEGYACVEGDDTSCNNDGFSSTAADTTTTPSNTDSSGKYAWPIAPDILANTPVTNCWRQAPPGTGHTGIDIPVSVGTPVHAAKDGTVVQVGGPNSDAGNYIIIKHADGHWTNYQHLSKVEVSVGQTVSEGQEIGKSGNTGNSTGPHLHFSLTTAPTLASRHNTAGSIDPLPFMSTTGAPRLACN